jgi:hypothetical protein
MKRVVGPCKDTAAAARLVLTGAVATALAVFTQAPKAYAQAGCPGVYRSTRLPTDALLLARRYYRPYSVPSPTASTSPISREEKKHPIHKREETHHHGDDGPPPGPTPAMRAAGAQTILQKRLGK